MPTNEDIRIREMGGTTNPFRVPDGYFENFDERLFARLPQVQAKPKIIDLVPRFLRYAAAVVIVVGVGSALWWNRNHSEPVMAYNEETVQESYYDEALDYIMVDNMEIAEYLTEADY